MRGRATTYAMMGIGFTLLIFSFAHTGALPSSAPSPAPQCSGTDDEFARCEIEALTHANSTWPRHLPNGDVADDGRPMWTQWKDKCSLKLDCAGVAPGTPVLNPLPQEFVSLDIPDQLKRSLQPDPRRGQGHPSADQPNPELAGVLYSREMEREALRLNNLGALSDALKAVSGQAGDLRQIPPSKLDNHSTIVKLIWQVVLPANNPSANNLIVYTPPSSLSTAPIKSDLGSYYRVDSDDRLPCPDIKNIPVPKNQPTPPPIPINCFYHRFIDSSDASVMSLLNRGAIDRVGGQPANKRAMIILLGANIMVFDTAHPQWRWITLFWTRTLDDRPTWNAQWADPWRHYEVRSTSVKPDGTLTVSQIANPYLEGHKDGMNTNCVSCHSLAAYTSSGNSTARAADLAKRYPSYPCTKNIASQLGYFNNAVGTHFIWSIPDNPVLNQQPLATLAASPSPPCAAP